MAKDIHERIKAKRLEKGLSMEQLAKTCGLKGYQAVQQWEMPEGKGGTSPRRKTLDRVAEALGVTAQWLQFGDEPIQGNCTAIVADWPFDVEKSRFDRLPLREKQRAGRAIRDIIETWESEHVERRQAG